MDNERQQLLERAQLIQQAREIQMRSMDPPGENHGPLDTVGEAATRLLDYPSGYLRSAAAAAQGLMKAGVTGDSAGIPTKQDWQNTVMGRAPIMADYNKRLGIPQGGSLSDLIPSAYATPESPSPWKPNKGGLLDPTARGALSTAEDIALSPGTLLSAGSSLAPKVSQTALELRAAETAARQAEMAKLAMNPVESMMSKAGSAAKSIMSGTPLSDAAESSGRSIYRQPFAKADLAAMDAGKGARSVSDLALENGVWGGSQESLEAQLRKLANNKASEAAAIEDANQFKTAIPTQTLVHPAMESALSDAFAPSPQRSSAGRKVYNELGQLSQDRPAMPLDDVIQYKRDQQKLASSMKQYDNPGVSPDPTGNAAFEGPLRQENANTATRSIEDAFDSNNPGSGGKYHQLNSEYGVLRSGMPGMNSSTKGEMLQAVMPSAWDLPVMAAGGYMTHSPEGALLGYLGSKAAGSPGFQTGAGLLMNRLGSSGAIDPVVRESALQRYRKGGTWSLMDNKEKKK